MPDEAGRKGWFARNWFWAVPVGCLSLLAAFGVFLAAILMVVFGAMRSSDSFQLAVERARDNPEVVAALGEPVEPAWWMSGNINVNGPSGEANLSIPLRGSEGSGTLYVVAEKKAGEWIFETLEVEIAGRAERVDLLRE